MRFCQRCIEIENQFFPSTLNAIIRYRCIMQIWCLHTHRLCDPNARCFFSSSFCSFLFRSKSTIIFNWVTIRSIWKGNGAVIKLEVCSTSNTNFSSSSASSFTKLLNLLIHNKYIHWGNGKWNDRNWIPIEIVMQINFGCPLFKHLILNFYCCSWKYWDLSSLA